MPYSKPPVRWSTSSPSQKPGAGSDVATVSVPGVAGWNVWSAMSRLSAQAANANTTPTVAGRRITAPLWSRSTTR